VIFASRYDTYAFDYPEKYLYWKGFDFFIFDRKLADFFLKSDILSVFEYCLGAPWWDYWLPCIALKKGFKLKYMKNFDIFHILHKINYDLEDYRKIGINFSNEFIPGYHNVLEKLSLLDKKQLDYELGNVITKTFLRFLMENSESILLE
ncbi:MAG: hypothetical protein VKL39_16495, partial [Leptolyngbyaceae bacterium]|nr:hypothetical protein [Leptolyngbyaceae bacterium]